MSGADIGNLLLWAGTAALALVVIARVRQGVWRNAEPTGDDPILPPPPQPWIIPTAVVGVIAALAGTALVLRG